MRTTNKIQKNQNKAKKKSKIGWTFTEWRLNTYSNSWYKISPKNGINTFPNDFFQNIWLKVEDCKYNYNAEIEKKILGFAFTGKHILKNS